MPRKFACLFYRLIKHGQQYVGQRMEYYELESTEFWAVSPVWVSWSAWLTLSARSQIEPLVDQAFEALVGGDLAAHLLYPFLAHVFRTALHATGVADLPVRPEVVLGILVLTGERPWTHRADLQQRALDRLQPEFDRLNPFLAHTASFRVDIV